MKTTFIATVFNEEDSIDIFIKSLTNQTVFPDEVIIVDAKSSDKTLEKIKLLVSKSKYKKKFKIFAKKGNRSIGRNEAIKNSKNKIILCSDVGCILDKNWVRNIVKPFENMKVDVVSGYYFAKTENTFQKCLATYTCVMEDRVDHKNFLPSSRSIAFKKKYWEKAGKYPEWLNTCEDLVFDKNLKKVGAQFKFEKNAFVYWPQRKNITEAFKQFFTYAVGDGEARYIRATTPLLFLRYTIGMILTAYYFLTNSSLIMLVIAGLLTAYITWSILKNYKYIMDPIAIINLPLLQFTSDFAVILGMSIGLFKSLSIKK